MQLPYLKTGEETLDKAFRIALGDIVGNIYPFRDGLLTEEAPCIIAGLGYETPWTRDAAINTWNCCGLLFPEVAKNTLLSVVNPDGPRVGGEYWDAIIWVVGAWNYYLYTADRKFLELAYTVTVNSIAHFEKYQYVPEEGLFKGPACYGDGVAAYPDHCAEHGNSGIIWYVKESKETLEEKPGREMYTLSTNCLYYEAYVLADKMAHTLGKAPVYAEKATAMKEAINRRFWLEEEGCYAYLLDHRGLCDYQEGMGRSFAVLFGIASEDQISRLMAAQHITPQGIACVWPAFPRYRVTDEDYGRHSGTVWPHIQAFWASAALLAGRNDLFEKEFRTLAEKAVRDNHFAELYHPVTGLMYGGVQEQIGEGIIHWDSQPRQTWSATGFLRLVLEGVFGMVFRENSIQFVAPAYAAPASIRGLPWCGSELDITVSGCGSRVTGFRVDGIEQPRHEITPGTGRTIRVQIRLEV